MPGFTLTLDASTAAATVLVFAPAPDEAVLIGRSADNALILDTPTVSATHASIRQMEDGWLLTDLQSKNGTSVNGLPVTVHWLQAGDVISLGGRQLQFHPTPAEAALGRP